MTAAVTNAADNVGNALGALTTEIVTPISSQVDQTVNHVIAPITNILHSVLG